MEGKNTAPAFKVFTAYADFFLVVRNKNDVGENWKKLKTNQKIVRTFHSAAEKVFQDFRSLGTLKWHLLDNIVED